MNDTDARVNDLERITEKLMILWAESETESKECSYAKLELRKEILELKQDINRLRHNMEILHEAVDTMAKRFYYMERMEDAEDTPYESLALKEWPEIDNV